MDENLAKDFIWHSKSLPNALIVFVKKKDECLEMCVNYYGFNKVIIKNWYSFLLILSLFDQLSQAKIYTKIYLHVAYSFLCIKEGDEWKTTFQTRYGHFEYNVMLFKLTNVHAIFQHLMNDILQKKIEQFCCHSFGWCILIFSQYFKNHQHVHLVLQKLCNVGLYVKLEKCAFH